MNLKLTRHFQDMMQHRGVNLDHVKGALIEPDRLTDAFGGALKAVKSVDGRIIEVIYRKEKFADRKDEYLVITAYYI